MAAPASSSTAAPLGIRPEFRSRVLTAAELQPVFQLLNPDSQDSQEQPLPDPLFPFLIGEDRVHVDAFVQHPPIPIVSGSSNKVRVAPSMITGSYCATGGCCKVHVEQGSYNPETNSWNSFLGTATRIREHKY